MKAHTFTFSIIIPTYNRPEKLAACLESLTKLDYPQDKFEVIVVDDGSALSLEPTVAPFRDRLNLTLISQPNAGPAKARNTGVSQAQGQFLVFTDDDCHPLPDWLNAFDTGFEASPKAMLGGKTLNALVDNPYSTASQLLIDYLYEYYNDRGYQAQFFASNNLALPTTAFRELGSFDTTFPLAAGEDRELCDRWIDRGNLMVYLPQAQIFHAHYLTLKTFWRQHFNYGRGAYYFHKIRAERGQKTIKLEPISFYSSLLSYPFKQKVTQPRILLGGLFFMSQVANTAGFFWEKYQH